MSRKAVPETPAAPASVPDWFRPETHFVSTYGIHDRATGLLLDAEGQPVSPAARRLIIATPSEEILP